MKVYDEDNECFIDETKCIFQDETIYRNLKAFQVGISEDLSVFDEVKGLLDINGEKIHALSSIVEFEYPLSNGKYEKTKGYFYLNKKTLRYNINVFIGNKTIWYYKESMRNFKIIDTIQENKKGLIK